MKKILLSLVLVGAFSTMNAQTILFEDDFEAYSPPSNTGDGNFIAPGYTSYDVNGNGKTWGMSNPDFWTQPMGDIYSGNFMISATYLQSGESIYAENILVLPAINIPAGATDVKLDYYIGSGTDTGYYAETYEVIVTTENSQAAILAATPVFSETLPSQGGFDRSINLDAFAGQTVYISFFHTDSYDKWILGLDNIVVSANEGEPVDYCIPDPLMCDDGDLIYNVTFAGIDNDSDCSPNGYGDYTETVSPGFVVAGETYDISLTIGDGWYEKVSMWIDFDNNGVFDADERFDVVEGDMGGTLTNTITIPEGVADGVYRMRIYLGAMGSSGDYPQDPCVDETSEIYGEVEDYMVEVGTLGISDLNNSALALYPNPVKDAFKLNLPQSFNSSKVTVTVSDMTGKIVKNFASSASYNVSDLASGVYVVTVSDGKNVQTKKIIKN
jgi:hypothetical protein